MFIYFYIYIFVYLYVCICICIFVYLFIICFGIRLRNQIPAYGPLGAAVPQPVGLVAPQTGLARRRLGRLGRLRHRCCRCCRYCGIFSKAVVCYYKNHTNSHCIRNIILKLINICINI